MWDGLEAADMAAPTPVSYGREKQSSPPLSSVQKSTVKSSTKAFSVVCILCVGYDVIWIDPCTGFPFGLLLLF